MRKVIINSTPMIILGNTNKLSILKEIYKEIIIPKAVFDEISAKNDKAKSSLLQNQNWIKILEVKDKTNRKIYQSKLQLMLPVSIIKITLT